MPLGGARCRGRMRSGHGAARWRLRLGTGCGTGCLAGSAVACRALPSPPTRILRCALPPLQVTREVGQECLKIQAQMRGGLLGSGHSWFGKPADAPKEAGGEAAAAAAAAAPAAAAAAAAPAAEAGRGPGLLARAGDRLFNAWEDALDALDEPAVTLRAPSGALALRLSGGALLGGLGGALAAAAALVYLQQLLLLILMRLRA